jgi:hypothetical protein
MSNTTQTKYGIISINEFLERSVLVDYVYDQLTLSSWEVNSLSASYHLSVGLKGTLFDISDDISDNYNVTFFVNGSSYFQSDCILNGNCNISKNLFVNGNLNVGGNTVFDNELTVKDMNITNNLNVLNDSSFNNNVFIEGILDVSSNLNVRDDVLLYTKLNVSGNTSLYSNLYVNKNVLVNSNVSINGAADISNSLIVKGPVSFNSSLTVIDKSFFKKDVVVDTNLSSPTLYTSNIATIQNLSVINNASLNTLYVNNKSTFNDNIISLKNTSLNELYVTNNASFNGEINIKQTAVINNLSVQTNTKLNTLNVSGNTTLSTTNVNSLLNVSQLQVNGATTLNILNVNGDIIATKNLDCNKRIYIGGPGNKNNQYSDSIFEVSESAYIGTLIAGKIRCDDINVEITNKDVTNDNNTTFILSNKVFSDSIIYTKYLFGNIDSYILTNTYTYGFFSHGLSTSNPEYNYTSTFDLSANSALTGITYNGPVDIGRELPNTFNLNANGLITYDGSMNIGQTTTTDFNLNGMGIINYDGTMNIGQNNLTNFNLNGNGVINYDGSMNIGQNSLSEFNLNASGIMKYDGIINVGSTTETYLDICANSLTTGIIYNGPVDITSSIFSIVSDSLTISGSGTIDYSGLINMNGPMYIEHDGETTLDVIGNTKIDGNILLGGNITSYSDIRIKDNICNLTSCLSKIDHISGYSFTRKDLPDKDKIYIGLIAQEVEEYFPDLVSETKDIKSINYQSMVAVLLECVKELKKEINELKIK